MRFKNTCLGINTKGQEGFSLPLTLVIGLIMTSSLMGAVYIAMNSNQGTRNDFLRFLGRTGLDSLRTQYKALLNDTNPLSIYHYFWIVNGCSQKTPKGECPTGTSPGELQNPSTTYQQENGWRRGGRQMAPMCRPNTRFPWNWLAAQRAVQQPFYQNGIDLNPSVEPSATGFVHSYTGISGGRARQQMISLIGGSQGAVNKAGRSTMINVQITPRMNPAGFAYIAARFNDFDREAVSLSNLRVLGNNSRGPGSGTILLRKNIDYSYECGNQVNEFHARRLPIRGNGENGGLSTFPAKFPPNPEARLPDKKRLRTVLFRQGENGQRENRLDPGQTYEYEELYLLPGSKLEINTSKPVTLKVRGNIHVAPGAKICNVSSFGQRCGSGKASQLTIMQGSLDDAKQLSRPKMQCDVDDRRSYTGEGHAIEHGGTAFTVQGTGRRDESLKAFIYAPNSTFTSAGVARSSRYSGRYQWVQRHSTQHRLAVVNKGGYLHLARRDSSTNASLFELRDEYNRPLRATDVKVRNQAYTGAGELQRNRLPYNARRYPIYLPNNVIMRHDLRTGKITTHGLTISGSTARIQRERPIQYRNRTYKRVCGWQWCRRYGYWWWYYSWYRCYKCNYTTVWTAQDLIQTDVWDYQMARNQSDLSRFYNVELMSISSNPEIANVPRSFEGSVWARNVCFSQPWNTGNRRDWIDSREPHQWVFNSNYIDEINARYPGKNYGLFGLPKYRATNEILVDSQRILAK